MPTLTKEEKAAAKLDAKFRQASMKERQSTLKALNKARDKRRKEMLKETKSARASLASPQSQELIKDHSADSKTRPSDIYDGLPGSGSQCEPLGRGGTANVYLVSKKGFPEQQYALKDVKLGRITDHSKREMLLAEIPVLKALDHPNIIKVVEVFRKLNNIYIVMEYCKGGELFDKLYDQPDECFTEKDTCILAKKMVSALRYLHKANIVHRDLKLENFIFTSTDDDAEIKLIDFGFSRQFLEGNEKMSEVVGTCYYVAPEVFKKCYGRASDMWSLGVVIYMMLTGEAPFDGDGNAAIVRDVKRQTRDPKRLREYITNSLQDAGVGPNCVKFVNGLLTVDPKKRLTAEKALAHPWIKMGDKVQQSAKKKVVRTHSSVGRSIKKFSEKSELQRAAMMAATIGVTSAQLKDLNQAFSDADKNGDGVIGKDEFVQLMKSHGIEDPSKVEEAFMVIDQDSTGMIKYSEFVTAAQEETAYQETSKIEEAFYRMDNDGDGMLTHAELQKLLGPTYNEEHVTQILKLADLDKDGNISKAEFAIALAGLPVE